jgi:adenine-specific DNA-methyltransferase
LPLPNIQFSSNEVSDIVTKILNIKSTEKNKDISTYENQIDQLVYQLYDLTTEEIEIIENSVK